jgi:hypothetical protein
MKVTWIDRWIREAASPDMLAMIMWSGNRDLVTWKIKITEIKNKGLPIMEDIINAWKIFKERFYEIGENVYKAEVFNNGVIGEDGSDVGLSIFSRNRYDEIRGLLLGIRLEQICGGGGL